MIVNNKHLFQKQPTHHYMRPYYLAAEETVQSSPKYCIGAQPRHKVILNYIEDVRVITNIA